MNCRICVWFGFYYSGRRLCGTGINFYGKKCCCFRILVYHERIGNFFLGQLVCADVHLFVKK